MNVLSMGLPFGTPGEPIQRFHSQEGHEVRSLSISGEAHYRFEAQESAQDLIERIEPEWRPDLMICWCPERMPPPRKIEDAPIRTVAVISDWTVYAPQLHHNLARFDCVISDKLAAKKFHPWNCVCHYLEPIYSQRSGVHRHLDQERDIDIFFAGNLNHATHRQRGFLLEKVASLADRFKVTIASGLSTEEYTHYLNRSRIAFNFGLRKEMNLRAFEAIACGALLFMEEENLEISDLLRDREQVVLYRPNNLVELLRHYLNAPVELDRIAAQGHARAQTIAGENRLDRILSQIAEIPLSGRPFATLSTLDRTFAEVLFYASSAEKTQRAYAQEVLRKAMQAHPDNPRLQFTWNCQRFTQLPQHDPVERNEMLQQLLRDIGACAAQDPKELIPWLNLAFIARHGNARHAEKRFLEFALEAETLHFADVLFAKRNDPYYARFREAQAFGCPDIAILRAGLNARLAEMHLVDKDPEKALDYAEQSIAYQDDIAQAHLTRGQALEALDRPEEALESYRQALPLTALDSTARWLLYRNLIQLKKTEEARSLARESTTLFSAWRGAEHVAQEFRDAP